MQNVFRSITDYLRMIKFSHSLFALPFAGVAVIEVIQNESTRSLLPDESGLIRMLVGILVCMVSMRSAAMGFNRVVDRKFDAANPRTANRELPSGIIPVGRAIFFVILFLAVFILAAFWIRPLAGWLSPVPIAITLGYSYTKRFTYLCHLFLGLALGLVPPAVWVALTGTISPESILWMSGITLYTAGFDILYASQDIDFDQKQNLRSIPAKFGLARAFWIARGFHLLSFTSFIAAALVAKTGLVFAVTLCVVGFLFFLQHRLVSGGRIDRIPIAFFNVNASISAIIFAGLLLDRYIR